MAMSGHSGQVEQGGQGQAASARERLDALRRWHGTIAAQIAGFQALIDGHQGEVARGLLPPEEPEWVGKEIRGWTRHLETVAARIAALEGEG